jgi:hypothetical protein
MSIQGSINQLLNMSMAGVRISPIYERRQEMLAQQKEAKAEEKAKAKHFESVTSEIESLESQIAVEKEVEGRRKKKLTPEQRSFNLERQEKLGKARSEMFALDPTEENLGKLMKTRKEINRLAEANLKIRQEEARPKKDFKDVPISVDGQQISTVGKLPESIQKQINAQLSSKQKKELTNEGGVK